MIIDKILDRKDGDKYTPHQFYRDVMGYGEIGFDIARAMDAGTEDDVKIAVCKYIIENDYNLEICKYIKSVDWL